MGLNFEKTTIPDIFESTNHAYDDVIFNQEMLNLSVGWIIDTDTVA